MKRPITPQLFLLSVLAGWLNREQQRVLDYLREENRVLCSGPAILGSDSAPSNSRSDK
jgi:hypothetical protein